MTKVWNNATLGMLLVVMVLPAMAADADEVDERQTIRFYPVQDLLLPNHGYRFDGRTLPGVDPSGDRTGFGGGGGGGGFGAGQQAVQGGFFAVPNQVAPQFGAGGGGGGGGGGQFTNMAAAPMTTDYNPLGIDSDTLITVITSIVEPEAWEDVGGPNKITMLGGRLVVRATGDVHMELTEFLKQVRLTTKSRLPVSVEAYWFRVDRTKAANFPTTDAALQALLKSTRPDVAGRVRCLNGQTVTISAGTRQTVTTDLVAVSGGTKSAYQPTSVFPNIGTLLEVKPQLLEGDKVMMNVHSTVSESNGKSTKRAHGNIELDDAAVDAQQIATTCVAKIGELFVAGGLAADDSANVGGSNTMFLVLRVKK